STRIPCRSGSARWLPSRRCRRWARSLAGPCSSGSSWPPSGASEEACACCSPLCPCCRWQTSPSHCDHALTRTERTGPRTLNVPRSLLPVTRRRLPAAATVALMLVASVIGLITATTSAGTATSAATGTAPAATGVALNGPIVVLGTGGLSWSDVSAQATPALWSLLRDGATAALSVRSVHANTCPVDGWLTLSAGEQAADAGPERASGAKPPCRSLPEHLTAPPAGMTAVKVPRWNEYLAAAAANRFRASPGLLGDQV